MADSASSSSSRATSRGRRAAPRSASATTARCSQPRAGHDARGLERHAGRGPPLPLDRRARAARPQGARGQPERPRRLRRAAARVHARAGAAARRRGLPRRLRARPVRARRRARLRAGRRRHDARPADDLRSPCSARCRPARPCCARAPAPATTSTSAARSATPASRSRRSAARRRARRRRLRAGPPGDGAAAAARRARRARCAASRRSAIDVSDGLPATSATSCAAPASAPSSTSTRLPRSAVLAAPADRRCSASACSPAATTTSCCSPRRRRARDAVAAAAAGARRRRSRGSARIEAGSAACAWSIAPAATRRPSRVRLVRPLPRLSASGRRRWPTEPARCIRPLPAPAHAPTVRFLLAPSGARRRARLRQRPVAGRAGHRRHAAGPGSSSSLLQPRSTSDAARGVVLGAAALVGWWACTVTARHLAQADPSAIVWDEVVAFWLVLWLRHAGRLLGAAGRLRPVPRLRCRQARPGGLGRPALQAAAAASRSAGRRASASCSTTSSPRSARWS